MRHRFVLPHAPASKRATLLRPSAWLLVASLAWACRSAGGDATAAPVASAVARGDHVVVEPRAAEFFEARVLSLGKTQLRVEPVGKHEGVLVSASDVYTLKGRVAQANAGQLAICHIAGRWTGCRVEQVRGDDVDVRTVTGEAARVRLTELLAASAATELNLRRAFGKLSSSVAFASAAARAGRPVAPSGYRVLPRSRVVALRASGWFSGTVADVRDDSAHVVFAPDNVSEPIATANIVPEPPASVAPGRGDFALVRPASPAEAWVVMRVLGPEERNFKVAGADALPRLVPARDVLPLAPASSDAP